ncbi:MAG TPA: 23S rRNA (guanosine(2251)-2'-O)-methyltransferase RlmB [Myxococcaceae bacterium]|nr:23S rRNA (guanosine(2251)-2'-O)-methyltransferase RlmB [Myxococcaceae bacterium]
MGRRRDGRARRGSPPVRRPATAGEAPGSEGEEVAAEAPARLVYGIHPVLAALRARAGEVERLLIVEGALPARVAGEVLSRAHEARVRVERVPRERLASVAGGGVHQGVVAELRGYPYLDLEELLALARSADAPPLLVVLDGIQDPHNLGAIVRSAHALGAHGVVLGRDRAAGITPAAAKASAGAVEQVRIARVVNVSRALERLKEAGLWVAAADPRGEQEPWSARLDGPLALVVGAEGAGVRPGVLGHADFRLRIPMTPGSGSLNASVAAGVLLAEVARQRASAERPRSASGELPGGRRHTERS